LHIGQVLAPPAEFMSYWSEFFTIAVAHLLAVASPGPDFAIVLRQSLVHGRRAAVWTSLGIGSGISLHVAYSLLGIGLLLKGSATAFTVLRYAGAAYLLWLGGQALRSRPRSPNGAPDQTAAPPPADRAAFVTGFLTNALNPKATLFFLALFPVAVSPATPKLVQAGYGLWVILSTMAWFCFVSLVFTRAGLRERFLRHGHWIDRALGVFFIGFAVSLLVMALE
jgi:RhtB (resistance to homoserine/threonine) family protein